MKTGTLKHTHTHTEGIEKRWCDNFASHNTHTHALARNVSIACTLA